MLFKLWNKLVHVNAPDPDDARRRWLLNIVLFGATSVTFLIMGMGSLIAQADPLTNRILVFGLIFSLLNIGLYFLNRNYSGSLASLIFTGLLIVLIVLSDSPQELVAGRSLFFFSIPIVFASVLLRPWLSIAVAIICSVVLIILSFQASLTINTLAIGGFLLLALFSWLSSTGIENALGELRTLNRELDARVANRTAELARANERLTELDRLRSKFVADVSHELRTPVGNLVAYLEMFEERKDDPERSKRYLSVLSEETTRLQMMVNSVLNLSRIELGAVEQEFLPLDLQEVAQQVVLAHQLRAEAQGLKLTYETSDSLPAVWADRNQIIQVFNNIIGNAVNYTMADGSILVKTYAEKDKVIFEVSDTGIGIAPEDLPYLFDRFYRGQNTGSSTIAGSGLGLSITKELVQAHKGSIEVSSELRKGTTFRVLFPVYDPSANEMNQ